MAYTDIDDPSAFFQTTLYTGNGSNDLSITNGGNSDLQPDFTWLKQRDSRDHFLFDSVRGVLQYVASNTTAADDTLSDGLKSFDSDGFTIDDGVGINENNDTHVSWNWKAGTALNNSAGANGGSIATTGSINTTSGFGIVKYEGSGADATIYHGLGKIPRLIITKNIDQTFHWSVYTFNSNTKILRLNGTNAEATESAFQSTHPTATVQSLGDHNQNNGATGGSADTHISYMFCDVPGYQKIGSYTGNENADGNFIHLGFKPAFVIIKLYGQSGDWWMWDNKRNTANPITKGLKPNTSSGESTPYTAAMDFLSNGFKIREAGSDINRASGLIYMAFAEHPFVTSKGVPATAR